jgi:hypothetical protein
MSVTSVFPRRPLRLLRAPSGRIGLWPVIGFLLFLGAVIADVIFVLPSIYDDATLGSSGTLARDAHLGQGGKCRSKVFTMCDFDVTYRTGDGASRQASLHYVLVFQSVGDSSPLSVRYDPANPARISTSWGQDLLVNRIATNAALLAIVALLLGFFVMSHLGNLRTRRSLLAMAGNPRAVIAKLAGRMKGKTFTAFRFDWTDPATGTRHKDSSRVPGTTEPFWLDRERTTMLALAGPDGHAHLLDEDLSLVDLTDDERRAIRGAAGSRSPAGSVAA